MEVLGARFQVERGGDGIATEPSRDLAAKWGSSYDPFG
jgi:hypothetical protein